MCKLGALQKARLRKIHFSGDFLGVFWFSQERPALEELHKQTTKFNRVTDFYKHPL